MKRILFIVPVVICWFPVLVNSADTFNYDESKVPLYKLPDPLISSDGSKIADVSSWKTRQRPELLKLFEAEVYGRVHEKPVKVLFVVVSRDNRALGGRATRKEVDAYLLGTPNGPKMRILLYVPNEVAKPVPAFTGLNFNGNHTVAKDPGISLAEQWVRDGKDRGLRNIPGEETRGSKSVQWSVELLLSRGYALATVYYGDLEPDFPDGWKFGVRAALAKDSSTSGFADDDWGAIGVWAWGLGRVMDYLETDSDIDARHVAVIGHSRLGKTALWAGAVDERFSLVISNNSGCGGAALSRRAFGETVKRINTRSEERRVGKEGRSRWSPYH